MLSVAALLIRTIFCIAHIHLALLSRKLIFMLQLASYLWKRKMHPEGQQKFYGERVFQVVPLVIQTMLCDYILNYLDHINTNILFYIDFLFNCCSSVFSPLLHKSSQSLFDLEYCISYSKIFVTMYELWINLLR